MPLPTNKHGTVICTNCNDVDKSVHSYKQPAAGKLLDSTTTFCLNCNFTATWSAVKPQ